MSRQRSAYMVSAALLCLSLPGLGAAQAAGAGDSTQRKLPAQTPTQGSAANPELAAAMQALRPGHLVRISANGVRDTGRVALASSSQLAFRHRRPMAPTDTVPAASIDSLWTWKSHSGSGARIGGIVVGTLGALTGLALSGATLDYEPSGAARLKMAVPFGIAGGLVGVLFGGTIGGLFSHWKLDHPRRP